MKNTIAITALAAAFVLNAPAQAEDLVHANVNTVDLTQQIKIANNAVETKLFELVMNKAEAGIELKLAKIENTLTPKPISNDDLIVAAARF